MSDNPYGCFNRQTQKGFYLSQRRYVAFGQYIMEPTYIRHAMTTECQHTKHNPDDPRCGSCNNKVQHGQDHA